MRTTTLAIAAAMAAGTLAHAQEAVQWRVEDGGNGHWYQLLPGAYWWDDARTLALASGGDLAALETQSERLWCRERFEGNVLLGGLQQQPASHPNANWVWLTGPVIDAPLGCDDSPCGCCPGESGDQDYIHFGGGLADILGDVGIHPQTCPDLMPALVEWSADCNGDGIVDYGQILDGTFEDANENGVPDCCEDGSDCNPADCDGNGISDADEIAAGAADLNGNGVPDTCECLADLTGNGEVNGADISIILGFWGKVPEPLPAADINQDGNVDGLDLAVLLGNWGPCQ